jgi:2-polyprenyl-3-methyl-5-hydroxy-6-metoxy-1,4-benzoquinol methylase
MPFSQSTQISTIVKYAEELQPLSILDLGTGMGQYGFLLRTNLENEHLFEVTGAQGRLRPREDWRIKIDGVEGCTGYMTPVHAYAYNTMTNSDVLEALPKIGDSSYDLVLAVDILEHLTTHDGLVFLDHCKRVAKRAALISTPKIFHPQEVEANPFENHRSLWSAEQLAAKEFTQVLPNADSWVAIYTRPRSHNSR